MLNLISAILMFGLIVAFRRIATIAAELPRGEGYDEEVYESAADDTVMFRVVSDAQDLPVELKRN